MVANGGADIRHAAAGGGGWSSDDDWEQHIDWRCVFTRGSAQNPLHRIPHCL